MDMELTDSAPPDAPDEHTKPDMTGGSQTSCHRVSEIDFVNEVTNERKSIIPPAWIHQATHQYPSQVLTYAHWRSMTGCLEARVGGPGRTRTCNNTVMSRGF